MPLILSVLLAKLAARSSRMLRRGGGQSLPGLVALRLTPDGISRLAGGIKNGVIVVTGTNGKTTTTKMLVEIFERAGERVLTNASGSNLRQGIASSLVLAARVGRRSQYDRAIFEIDEASLRVVAPELQPTAIVVLNLFRDQLDRYGELDTLARVIGEGIAGTQAELVLNADDALVRSLARFSTKDPHFFGLDLPHAQTRTAIAAVSDSDRCPLCHQRLKFSKIYYGHIGIYACPTGDFSRPAPGFAIESAEFTRQGTQLAFRSGKHTYAGSIQLPGLYNLYNAVAALAVAASAGLDLEQAVAGIAQTTAAFGRVERIRVKGRVVCLLLIKNPAGFAQVLETFVRGQTGSNVLFVVNDLDADGRDISWLWDVPLEDLAKDQLKCMVAGIRGADMQVRLKYAGIEAARFDSVAEALNRLIAGSRVGEEVYVLPTYTAMLEIRRQLGSATGTEQLS